MGGGVDGESGGWLGEAGGSVSTVVGGSRTSVWGTMSGDAKGEGASGKDANESSVTTASSSLSAMVEVLIPQPTRISQWAEQDEKYFIFVNFK